MVVVVVVVWRRGGAPKKTSLLSFRCLGWLGCKKARFDRQESRRASEEMPGLCKRIACGWCEVVMCVVWCWQQHPKKKASRQVELLRFLLRSDAVVVPFVACQWTTGVVPPPPAARHARQCLARVGGCVVVAVRGKIMI